MISVRPATREDIAVFSSMADTPTIKAWCMDCDGKIIALGGLALVKGRYYGFCDLTPEARRYKKTIVKTAKQIFADAKEQGIRFIYAEADPNEPNAVRWIKSLGFSIDPRTPHIYRWTP